MKTLLMFVFVASVWSEVARKYEFSSFKPLPYVGKYNVGPGAPSVQRLAAGDGSVPAVFLGLAKGMEIVEINSERKVARRVIPAPILRPDVDVALSQTFAQLRGTSSIAGSQASSVITDRDGGCFDSLRYIFAQGLEFGSATKLDGLLGRRSRSPSAIGSSAVASTVMKRLAASTEAINKASVSPYAAFARSLADVLGVRVCGLLIEVADRPNSSQIYVGGALVLSAVENVGDLGLLPFSAETCLSWIRYTQNVEKEDSALILKCHTDEVIGLSAGLGLPIVASKTISEMLALDVLIKRSSDDTELEISGPHFPSKAAKQAFERGPSPAPSSPPSPPPPPPSAEVDATTFLQMSQEQRRAWLRNQLGGGSNTAVPRPREGLKSLNAACYQVMTVDVVYEILRRLAECDGDEKRAAEMPDFASYRPGIAKEIRVAQSRGDQDEAAALTQKLYNMSRLNYDPFRPLLKMPVDFDVEEWIFKERQALTGERKIG